MKKTWKEAVRDAVHRLCKRKGEDIFDSETLFNEELERIIEDTQTKGKTPRRSVALFLQELRDDGVIEFLDNQGTYKLL